MLIKTSPGSPYLAKSLLKSSSVISAGKFPTNNRQRCVYVFSPGRLSRERFALNPYKESDQFEPPLSAAQRIAGSHEDPRRTQTAAPGSPEAPRESPNHSPVPPRRDPNHSPGTARGTARRCKSYHGATARESRPHSGATRRDANRSPGTALTPGTARIPLRRRRLSPAPPLKMAARARGAAAILCLREVGGSVTHLVRQLLAPFSRALLCPQALLALVLLPAAPRLPARPAAVPWATFVRPLLRAARPLGAAAGRLSLSFLRAAGRRGAGTGLGLRLWAGGSRGRSRNRRLLLWLLPRGKRRGRRRSRLAAGGSRRGGGG